MKNTLLPTLLVTPSVSTLARTALSVLSSLPEDGLGMQASCNY